MARRSTQLALLRKQQSGASYSEEEIAEQQRFASVEVIQMYRLVLDLSQKREKYT